MTPLTFKHWRTAVAGLFAAAAAVTGTAQAEPMKPNIVIIYADDLGVGDVGAYGQKTVSTPNIDRLAAEGVRFNQAFATAAMCTPSRYSLLTGGWPFRNNRAQILDGDARVLIEPGTPTLPSVLKSAGYATAVVGKWHLGLGDGKVDWNGEIKPGPLEIGFDESLLLPATNDRVPTVLVEGHRVAGLDPSDPLSVNYNKKVGDEPTGRDHPEMLRYPADGQHSGTIVNGISRIGWQAGGRAAWWDDERLAADFVDRSKAFMEEKRDGAGGPFFLFLSLHQIHQPRTPASPFQGKSQTGIRGDSILELDWTVGQIVEELRRLGKLDDTLIVFSSDNGPIFWDGYDDGAAENAHGHKASGESRGGKYQAFEGGCRVPMIVHWPARVRPGVSDALVSQVDLMHSLASLVGADLPAEAAPDSLNELPVLLGRSDDGRDHVIEMAAGVVSIRSGKWKLIPAGKRAPFAVSKHNTHPNPLSSPTPSAEALLYDIDQDPAETTNVAAEHPEVVERLSAALEKVRAAPERPGYAGDAVSDRKKAGS